MLVTPNKGAISRVTGDHECFRLEVVSRTPMKLHKNCGQSPREGYSTGSFSLVHNSVYTECVIFRIELCGTVEVNKITVTKSSR